MEASGFNPCPKQPSERTGIVLYSQALHTTSALGPVDEPCRDLDSAFANPITVQLHGRRKLDVQVAIRPINLASFFLSPPHSGRKPAPLQSGLRIHSQISPSLLCRRDWKRPWLDKELFASMAILVQQSAAHGDAVCTSKAALLPAELIPTP